MAGKWQGGIVVYNKRSTSNGVFHPITGAMGTATLKYLRGALKMESSSGDIKITLAYQLSNDGETWVGPYEVDEANLFLDDDGTDYATDYSDIYTDGTEGTKTKRLARFGVLAVNDSDGTHTTLCRAWIQLAFRSC